jgi:hypothetical protein
VVAGVATMSGSMDVPAAGNSVYQVNIGSTNEPITLSILSHGAGVATFSSNSTSMTISGSQAITLHGVTASGSRDEPYRGSGGSVPPYS